MLFPDLSEFQTAADIVAIRKQTSAIILRVAYGESHPDSMFVKYRAEAHAAGYTFVGLYQYLVAGQDVGAQASAFCKLVDKLQPCEIPILDLEEGNGSQLTRAYSWYAYVDAYFNLGVLPINQRSWIYSNPSFAASSGIEPIFNSSREGWVAAYAQTPPTLPHTLWQSTDGKVGANRVWWPGCGYIDTNSFAGTAVELAAKAWHPKAVTPQEEEMLNVQIAPSGKSFVPFPKGSFKQAIVFSDFVSATDSEQVRLAIHSTSKGFATQVVTLKSASPTTVTFPEADTDAVSIENEGTHQTGVTFA